MTRGRSSAVLAVVLAAGAAGLALAALAARSRTPEVVAAVPLPAPGLPEVPAAQPPPLLDETRSALVASEKKLSPREVGVLVTSLQEPPLRDPCPARERVLRTLDANRDLALAELRRVRVASLAPSAQASIRDAMRRLGD